MAISAAIYHVLHFIHIIISIQNVSMSLSYLFLHYHHQVLTFQVAQARRGWASAASITTVKPEHVSWSVAVFWDNDGIAIFCILFTYTCWLRQQTLVPYITGQVCHSSFLHDLFTGSLCTPDHHNPFLYTPGGAPWPFLPADLCGLLYCYCLSTIFFG